MATLTREYLARAASSLEASDAAAKELLSRLIKHILLLHISRFAASTLDALLSTLAQHRASFVSLDDALADPVYTDEPRLPTLVPGDLLTQIGASRRRTLPVAPAPPAELLASICQ